MFKVVEGSSLRGTVRDADSKYFFGASGRMTESEYKSLLEDSQKYFDGIESGAISLSDDYYIYAPDYYLEYGFATDIAVIRNEKLTGVNAKILYIEQSIKVRPCKDGYIFAGKDGSHRFHIAQKYNLKLLVEIESVSKIDASFGSTREPKRLSILKIIKNFHAKGGHKNEQ